MFPVETALGDGASRPIRWVTTHVPGTGLTLKTLKRKCADVLGKEDDSDLVPFLVRVDGFERLDGTPSVPDDALAPYSRVLLCEASSIARHGNYPVPLSAVFPPQWMTSEGHRPAALGLEGLRVAALAVGAAHVVVTTAWGQVLTSTKEVPGFRRVEIDRPNPKVSDVLAAGNVSLVVTETGRAYTWDATGAWSRLLGREKGEEEEDCSRAKPVRVRVSDTEVQQEPFITHAALSTSHGVVSDASGQLYQWGESLTREKDDEEEPTGAREIQQESPSEMYERLLRTSTSLSGDLTATKASSSHESPSPARREHWEPLPLRMKELGVSTRSLAAGPDGRSLMLRSDGSVWAWGKAALLDGSGTSTRPVRVLTVDACSDSTLARRSVACGKSCSIVIDGPDVIVWGEAVGKSSVYGSNDERLCFAGSTGVRSVSCGGTGACVAVLTDGRAMGWVNEPSEDHPLKAWDALLPRTALAPREPIELMSGCRFAHSCEVGEAGAVVLESAYGLEDPLRATTGIGAKKSLTSSNRRGVESFGSMACGLGERREHEDEESNPCSLS